MKYIILSILVFFIFCIKPKPEQSQFFDAFVFFNDSARITGSINYSDTIDVKVHEEIRTRSIEISHVAFCGFRIQEFKNLMEDTIPPVKYTRKYTHVLRLKNDSHIPGHITIKNAHFYCGNKLYVLESRLRKRDTLSFYHFCTAFEKIMNAESHEDALVLMKELKNESNEFLHFQKVQLALHEKGYNTGTYCQAYGFPLEHDDSLLFKTAIMDFKKDNDLPVNDQIDSLLLYSLGIPIDIATYLVDKYNEDYKKI